MLLKLVQGVEMRYCLFGLDIFRLSKNSPHIFEVPCLALIFYSSFLSRVVGFSLTGNGLAMRSAGKNALHCPLTDMFVNIHLLTI